MSRESFVLKNYPEHSVCDLGVCRLDVFFREMLDRALIKKYDQH